jgi:glutathione S-transferase
MYKLYYFPSNANVAPHILLEEIGAPYELVLIDRTKGAHKEAAYLQLNPGGVIPTLIDGELVLTESAAICWYLAEQHPQAGLVGAVGSADRAHALRWLMYLTNTLQAEILHYYYPTRLGGDDTVTADALKSRAEARISGMLTILDNQLVTSHGPYLLGEKFCVADAFLFMLCRWTRNMAKPARDYPQLATFVQTMVARPSVIRAMTQEGVATPWV